jgi:hypothetical protein
MPTHPPPHSRGAHKLPANYRSQRTGSLTSPNNNRQRINHFAPNPPANPPPPGYTIPGLHARPKAGTARTRSAVPDFWGPRLFLRPSDAMAQPTHRAHNASDGLGRIANPAPQPLPAQRTHLGPTPIQPRTDSTRRNLPHLTESAIPCKTAVKIGGQTQFRPESTRATFQNVSKRFKCFTGTTKQTQLAQR